MSGSLANPARFRYPFYLMAPEPNFLAVDVRFPKIHRIFRFQAGRLPLAAGTAVVADGDHGYALGEVLAEPFPVQGEEWNNLRRVVRIATDQDHTEAERNRSREDRAFRIAQEKIRELSLPMKLIRADMAIGIGKVTLYFSAPDRVDFRALVRALTDALHLRIELFQIGVRDESKMLGGLGMCGREFCCSGHLRNFHPVSIRMAKLQNLALNTQKLSGGCGRLLCCLAYEVDHYGGVQKKSEDISEPTPLTTLS